MNTPYLEQLTVLLIKQVDDNRALALLRRCSFNLDKGKKQTTEKWKREALDEVGHLLRPSLFEKLNDS